MALGPLTEFQRRFLDVTQQRLWLKQANIGGPDPEYFGYPLVLGSAANPLTNGVAFQGLITIQSDAWFLWTYTSVMVVLPADLPYGDTTQFSEPGNMLIQITNTGTGDDLYAIPSGQPGVPATLSAGSAGASTAGIPFLYPTAVLLPPNTNINITATKMGSAITGDNPDPLGCYFALLGARVAVSS